MPLLNVPLVGKRRRLLPGAAKCPLFVVVMITHGLCLAAILLYMYLDAHYDKKIAAGACGASVLISGLVVYVVCTRRMNAVCMMLQQEAQLVAGDPACLMWLGKMPWYGVSEVDSLQLAVLQTFHSWNDAARCDKRSTRISCADERSAAMSWRSAYSSIPEEEIEEEEGLAAPLVKSPLRKPSTPVPQPEVSAAIPIPAAHERTRTGTPPPLSSYGAVGSLASPVGPLGALNNDPAQCDPLGDNNRPWEQVLRSIKDPGGSLLIQLLSKVKVGQDLSKVMLPVHILEPRSLLEKLSDVFVHANLLNTIDHPDPVQRLLNVARWYMSPFHMRPEGAKKPCNPILGEVFRCVFNAGRPDELHYIAEQVSHHPPVSVFYAEGCGVEVSALYFPKSKLVSLNSAASMGEGSLRLKVVKTGEEYLLTWPNAYVNGVMAGQLRLELGGKVTIHNKTLGFRAEIDFLRKAWISGKYDEIQGRFFSPEGKSLPMTLKGNWNQMITLEDQGNEQVFFNPAAHIASQPKALPTPGCSTQSRFIWRKVVQAVRNGNAKAAAEEKHNVEHEQRVARNAREQAGDTHQTTIFQFTGDTSTKDSVKKLENWALCSSSPRSPSP